MHSKVPIGVWRVIRRRAWCERGAFFYYKLESVDEQAQAAAAARQQPSWWLLRRFQFRQNVFADLLDSLILDVASEAHRAARLGFDYRLRNEEEDEARTCTQRGTLGDGDAAAAAAAENSGKYTVDVFDQTHPAIAQEMFDCMNCGRPIAAGRFAPHLEKCMGKGRKARLKPNSSVSASQPRRGRAAVPVSNNNAVARPSSKPPVRTLPAPPPLPQDSHLLQLNGTSSTPAGSPEAEKEDEVVAGPSHLGKARTKKTSLKLQRVNPGGAIKGRKVSEKKRKIGQVMAGSASVSNGGSTENGSLLQQQQQQLDAPSRPVDIMNNNNNSNNNSNNNNLDAPVQLPSFSSPSSWD